MSLPMKVYEYTYIVTDRSSAINRLEELNKFGYEGWHVVGQEVVQQTGELSFLLEREWAVEEWNAAHGPVEEKSGEALS